ncbi:MAG: CHC2 zinc finger domain-containing protein [Bacteroidaceae bacterium]|nr:CHC2 zinc finger domain-containing protein [Bacteroidaceae bacterium]
MDRYELQKLRDLPIEGVAERLGLRVTRHKSLCPFHDDHTASLSYHVGKNTCRCFVCMNESMGTIDLVMKHRRVDFKEACRWLVDGSPSLALPIREGMGSCRKVKAHCFDPKQYERFFERPWLSDEARKFLFDERRLDPRVISWCRVSSWRDRDGVNWLQTPYYDVDGKLIGVQNRNLDYQKASPMGGGLEGASRFKFPYGSQCSMYNLPVVKRLKPGDELWIAEGCSDAWSLLSSGRKAIAIPSATLLSPKDKLLLSSLSSSLSLRWSMYPDKDAPGERLFLQLKEILPDLEHHQLPLGCKDFSDYYVQLKSNSDNV